MKQCARGNLCGDEHRVPTDPTFYFIDFWNAKAFLALDNALRLGLISLSPGSYSERRGIADKMAYLIVIFQSSEILHTILNSICEESNQTLSCAPLYDCSELHSGISVTGFRY